MKASEGKAACILTDPNDRNVTLLFRLLKLRVASFGLVSDCHGVFRSLPLTLYPILGLPSMNFCFTNKPTILCYIKK